LHWCFVRSQERSNIPKHETDGIQWIPSWFPSASSMQKLRRTTSDKQIAVESIDGFHTYKSSFEWCGVVDERIRVHRAGVRTQKPETLIHLTIGVVLEECRRRSKQLYQMVDASCRRGGATTFSFQYQAGSGTGWSNTHRSHASNS